MRGFRRKYSQGGSTPKPSDDDLRTRFVGTCPVCQKRQKLHDNKLVHHGYQRPGHGSIVGDCYGVGYEAYELSTKGCEEYREHAKGIEASHAEMLAKLESGETRTLHVLKRKYLGMGEYKNYTVTLSADSADAKEVLDFEEELASQIAQQKAEVKGWKFEQERMTKLITAWTLKPIITWQEHLEVVKREKFEAGAERRAELAAKRAARAEKARLLAEKKVAWKQEKADLIAKYKALFEKLATGVESLQDRQQCARTHWADMCKARSKKGYLNFYDNKLECDDALITLGLAKKRPNGDREYTSYADKYGHVYS